MCHFLSVMRQASLGNYNMAWKMVRQLCFNSDLAGLPILIATPDINCTIPMITDPFFHLLEFYIHNDAPLSCRIPSRPPAHVIPGGEANIPPEYQQEFV